LEGTIIIKATSLSVIKSWVKEKKQYR